MSKDKLNHADLVGEYRLEVPKDVLLILTGLGKCSISDKILSRNVFDDVNKQIFGERKRGGFPPDTTDRELVLFCKHSGTVEKVVFDFDIKEHQNEDINSKEKDESMNEADDAADEKPKQRTGKQRNKPSAPNESAAVHILIHHLKI